MAIAPIITKPSSDECWPFCVSLSAIIKGIKNGCPCIVKIRGTQGCALVVGSCRDVAKAQP